MIKAVGPGGHFLDQDHTFEHFRQEFYQPMLSNRDNFDTWLANGSQQILQTANKKVKQILGEYSEPALPADADEDLKRFIDTLG